MIQIRTWTDGRVIFEWAPSASLEEAAPEAGTIAADVDAEVEGASSSEMSRADLEGDRRAAALEEDGEDGEEEGDGEGSGEGAEEEAERGADRGRRGEDRRRGEDLGIDDGNPLCAAVVAAVRAGADLTCADLSDADLRGANLEGARLAGAWLEDADLGRACLVGACLDLAILRGADLEHASLVGASLRGADLSRANLDRSTLHRADLSHAILCSAWLDGANLRGAVLADLIVDEHTTSTCLAHFADEDRLVQAILDVDRLCRRSVGKRGESRQDAGWLSSASSTTIARRLLIDRAGFQVLAQEISAQISAQISARIPDRISEWIERIDRLSAHLDDAYGQVLVIATLRDRTDVLRQLADHLRRVSGLCDADLASVPGMQARLARWGVMRVLAAHRSAGYRPRPRSPVADSAPG